MYKRCLYLDQLNIAELLIESRCEINTQNNIGWSALHEAAHYGSLHTQFK